MTTWIDGSFVRILLDGEGAPCFARVERDHLVRWSSAPWLGGHGLQSLAFETCSALLAPTAPSKVICVGRNYRAHAAELGNDVPVLPLLFLKPPSSVIGTTSAIELPPESERVEFEAEFALVIGKKARRITSAEASDVVFGVTLANDVTARDIQRADVQFTRGKGFDTFCPLGPAIVPGFLHDSDEIVLLQNGTERQRGRVSEMVFAPSDLVSFVSQVMTLEPGDVLLTGTPAGVGPMAAGDHVVVSSPRLGSLHSIVR